MSRTGPEIWSLQREIEGAVARCEALRAPGIAHGFGLRSHDVGPSGSSSPAHLQARRALSGLCSVGARPACPLRQVHGARIERASGGTVVEADGACERVERLRGGFLAVRTADCVPILLVSRDGAFAGAVHAGWRGTALGVARRAVAALARLGCPPGTLIAAAGPAIGACCYRVSPEVAREVAGASGAALEDVARVERDRAWLDLHAANRRQLLDAGVPENAVHAAPWCTFCEADLFFSHRREGPGTGRQWSLIGPLLARP